jgi:hypothetical protein
MKKLLLTLLATASAPLVFATCPQVQYGTGVIPGSQGSVQVVLPCAEPDTNYSVVVSGTGASYGTLNNTPSSFYVQILGQYNTGGQYPYNWIAVENPGT